MDLGDEEILEVAASRVSPGSEGLLLVPYWNTTSTPYWDTQASGVMLGFRGRHKKAHVYRAVMEGIAFEQRLGTDGMEKGLDRPIETLLATGGGSRSPLFSQIVADVTGKPVTLCKEVETTALGAAVFAAAATDDSQDIREVAATMSGEGETYEPDEKRAKLYDRIYNDVYKEIYPRLAPLFPALADATKTTEDG